ncbi:hypothetical protein [Allobranchiibius sp. GilTou38]|uniref:hypothetical protein n=1 Tax=Allobranchiibius sp. GilTou38 TaxID=2815210 RepID=UPI001AA18028|nr:hypothetical protein [Allobranchiibius sp. GilTou38]MBO1767287.1 hypothetical protein [Allobranchiibius sp. GilTou38]
MSIFDRIFGRSPAPRADPATGPAMTDPTTPQPTAAHGDGDGDGDQRAIERYQYLLRTAPPDKIEQAHQEAFAQLTPQQRQQVLQTLSEASPADRPQSDSAADLARSATRVEMQRPGSLTQIFGGRGMGMGGGMGMGIGGMLLTSVAGSFIGSAIAQEMFDDNGDGGNGDAQNSDDQQQDNSAQDTGSDNSGADQAAVADDGSAGYDGGDVGGGFDAGFDGGDVGGGDF